MSSKKWLLDSRDTRQEIFHADGAGNFTIETRQDCAPIVAACAILADEPPDKDFRHVAKIPATVFDKAMREGWLHDEQAWKKWLNDPDNRKFRTWGGRV